MIRLVTPGIRRGLQVITHCLCALLLLRVYWLGYHDQLGGDPVKAIIHYTGIGALNLLLLTLTVSPLNRLLKQPQLMRLRRPLGLWCFAWACAHIGNYLIYDLQLEWSLVAEELTKRPYILVGLTGWLILLSLAITSIPVFIRLLKQRWKTLHRLIYPTSLLICIHFWWSVKADITEPLIYAGLALLLLLLRWRPRRRSHPVNQHQQRQHPT